MASLRSRSGSATVMLSAALLTSFERTAMFCEKWDQNSFDPDFDTMPFSAFEPMVRRLFAKKPFFYGN